MIARLILLKLYAPHATPEGRAEVARVTRDLLLSLPQVRGVRIGGPADPDCARQWDLCAEILFERVEDIDAYLAERRHADFVAEYLAPRTEARRVWNFEALTPDPAA